MKLLLSLILIMASTHTYSQTKTGSGGVDDDESVFTPGIVVHDGGTSTPKDKLNTFVSLLRFTELECRNNGLFYLSRMDDDILKIYIKLSIIRVSFIPDETCSSADEYFKCLADNKNATALNEILKDKDIPAYLMKKYKINKQQADGMLKFFKATLSPEK